MEQTIAPVMPVAQPAVPAQTRWRRWRTDIVGVLGVLVIVLLFGHRLLGARVSMPGDIVSNLSPWAAIAPMPQHNGILHDVPLTVYPNRFFINTEIQHGHFPLWDPYSEMGQPAAGDPNVGLFYPITLALAWLSPGHALNVEILIHMLAAALGMYVLVRLWGGHPLGALAAAAAFIGCAPLTVWQQYGITYNVEAWLPWMVACYILAGRGRRFLWLGLGSLATGMLAVENVIQWTLYELLFLGCYALFVALQFLPARDWRRIVRRLADAAIIAGVGVGIGMIQMLPFVELALLSPRADVRGYAYLRANAAPVQQLLTLFAPNFFGTPTVGFSLWGHSVGGNGGSYAENTIFFGIFPTLIALFAPLWRRTRLIWFLWGFTLLMATFTYGAWTLALLAHLPAFDRLKPIRMSYLMIFAGAALCGLVFDALFRDRWRWRSLVAIGGAALAVRGILHLALLHYQSSLPKVSAPTQESVRWVTWMAVAAVVILAVAMLRWPAARWGAAVAFLVLTVVDIAHWSIPYNDATFDENRLYPTPAVIAALPPSISPTRVAAMNVPGYLTLFSQNTLTVYRVSDIGAHSSLLLGEHLDFIGHIEQRDEHAGTFTALHLDHVGSPLIDLAGAEYLFSNQPLNRDGLELVMQAQGIYLYRNAHAQRAFIVTNVKPVTSTDDLWRTLDAPDFTPCGVAVVETTQPLPAPGNGQAGCVGTAAITHYEPNSVRIFADTPVDGLLVLNDTWYPGWQATVDGQAATIYKTDGTFRGVRVPAGAHDIQFTYRPASLLWGAALTGLSLLCAIGLIGAGSGTRCRGRDVPQREEHVATV